MHVIKDNANDMVFSEMDIVSNADMAEDGHPVIVHFSDGEMKLLVLRDGQKVQTRFGVLLHCDVIGQQYGSHIRCGSDKLHGSYHLLRLTPELWTNNLNHRTQILYTSDIAHIVFQLDLRCGSIVVETGTGSGSLSHSIVAAIGPTGHLFTFDYNIDRVTAAYADFTNHHVSSMVTCAQRDVLKEGFQLPPETKADAVFLDLPQPWDAIKHTVSVMKHGARISCFCPCIEQAQKSCQTLRSHRFQHVEMKEFVFRPYVCSKETVPTYDDALCLKSSSKVFTIQRKKYKYTHTGYLVFATYFVI